DWICHDVGRCGARAGALDLLIKWKGQRHAIGVKLRRDTETEADALDQVARPWWGLCRGSSSGDRPATSRAPAGWRCRTPPPRRPPWARQAAAAERRAGRRI